MQPGLGGMRWVGCWPCQCSMVRMGGCPGHPSSSVSHRLLTKTSTDVRTVCLPAAGQRLYAAVKEHTDTGALQKGRQLRACRGGAPLKAVRLLWHHIRGGGGVAYQPAACSNDKDQAASMLVSEPDTMCCSSLACMHAVPWWPCAV